MTFLGKLLGKRKQTDISVIGTKIKDGFSAGTRAKTTRRESQLGTMGSVKAEVARPPIKTLSPEELLPATAQLTVPDRRAELHKPLAEAIDTYFQGRAKRPSFIRQVALTLLWRDPDRESVSELYKTIAQCSNAEFISESTKRSPAERKVMLDLFPYRRWPEIRDTIGAINQQPISS